MHTYELKYRGKMVKWNGNGKETTRTNQRIEENAKGEHRQRRNEEMEIRSQPLFGYQKKIQPVTTYCQCYCTALGASSCSISEADIKQK